MYEIEGAPHPHGEVYVHWDNPYKGRNSYHQTTYPNFELFHEGGGGNNATVDFFFRKSQPHFAPFIPSVHGFKFVNKFDGSGINVAGIEVAIDALCGGMVFAALDYYYAGRVIPTNTSPPRSTDPWLYIYIFNRLFNSFTAGNALSFMQYSAPWYPDTDTGLGDGYSTVMVEQQFPAIRRQILNGSPVPLELVMVKSYLPSDLGHDHQVLVRGYQQSGQDVTLWLYDPNTPKETANSAFLKFNTSTLSTPIHVETNVWALDRSTASSAWNIQASRRRRGGRSACAPTSSRTVTRSAPGLQVIGATAIWSRTCAC